MKLAEFVAKHKNEFITLYNNKGEIVTNTTLCMGFYSFLEYLEVLETKQVSGGWKVVVNTSYKYQQH